MSEKNFKAVVWPPKIHFKSRKNSENRDRATVAVRERLLTVVNEVCTGCGRASYQLCFVSSKVAESMKTRTRTGRKEHMTQRRPL
jgi:hypothetical protein